jgi:hypothetical protein
METTGNRSQKAIAKAKENATKDSALVERAKEVAANLIEKYRPLVESDAVGRPSLQDNNAKACARIVCDEIMSIEFKWSHKYALYENVKKQLQ